MVRRTASAELSLALLSRLPGPASALTPLRNRRLLHAVPPRAPAETVTLVSQLRDRASQWAMKQWQEVQQAETGMKSWVKK